MKSDIKTYLPFPINLIINPMKVVVDGCHGIVVVILFIAQIFITVEDSDDRGGYYVIDIGARLLWLQLSGRFTIWRTAV